MRLALAYAKAEIVALLRYPTYAVSLIAGPSVVFYLVGVPLAFGHANRVMASFLAYALLGIVFFQFGISVALDRTSPWESFLRTLPVTPGVRFAGRALSALPFAASAALGIVVIACAGTSVDLSAYASSRLAAALLLGCLPFVLLGLALGYWLNPKAAAPVANMVYLVLVLGGGLWVIPRLLPHPVAVISPFLPTRQWAELLWASVDGRRWSVTPWLALAGYAIVFGALATWGYLRDEQKNFA
jgi:ABC-2 type transport system permease protein